MHTILGSLKMVIGGPNQLERSGQGELRAPVLVHFIHQWWWLRRGHLGVFRGMNVAFRGMSARETKGIY